MTKYSQGKIKILDPVLRAKYIGNIDNITFRSSWEKEFFVAMITKKSVIKISSEEVIIPYISPLDKRIHRYYVDYYIEIVNSKGQSKKILIEIKPFCKTQKPEKNKKKQNDASYRRRVAEFAVNRIKWLTAKEYCKHMNIDEFFVLTDNPVDKNKYKLWTLIDLGIIKKVVNDKPATDRSGN